MSLTPYVRDFIAVVHRTRSMLWTCDGNLGAAAPYPMIQCSAQFAHQRSYYSNPISWFHACGYGLLSRLERLMARHSCRI